MTIAWGSKRWKMLLVAIVLFGGGLMIGSAIVSQADGMIGPNEPGSANDPLVTKSYVDEQIRAALGQSPTSGGTGGGTSGAMELNIVQLQPGQTLIAGAGTELIVRNGATVVVSDSENGIPDVTSGIDITNGQQVETNHLLISPAEGRGIRPHDSVTGTVFVMVRGEYTLE